MRLFRPVGIDAMAEAHLDGALPAFVSGGGAAGALIAQIDWADTSLGPLDAWPQTLTVAAAMLLRSPAPMVLMWGEDGILIYNDAYARLLGRRHPAALGATAASVWPELGEFIEQMLREGLAGRVSSYQSMPITTLRSDRPEQLWFDIHASPVLDETGRPAGVLVIYVETTQRIVAEHRTARDIQRQRRMFEKAPGFICLLNGPDLVVEFVNEAHRRLFGDRHAEGRPFMEAFADILPHSQPETVLRVYETGERFSGRAAPIGIPRNGVIEEHIIDRVLEPVTDEHGHILGVFIEGFDVTDQVRAQAAAEESERRLSAAIAVARLGAFEWNLETLDATLDARAREIFAFGPDEILTVPDVLARIDREDMDRVRAENTVHDAANCFRQEYDFRIHLPDGSTRNIVSVSDSVVEPDGRRTRLVGVFDDVTERRAAEKRQRMLINELNHRVKNTLATVQSIAAQTLRSAPDLFAARDSFEARLVALAAAHDLLTAQSWDGARLTDIVASALAPFESVQRPQISRSGPPAWLAAQRALALALALHELATNAAKYGALSTPEGQVAIRWSLAGEALSLTWTETGGPAVRAPDRSGFGMRLLQRSLAPELQGEVTVDFAPEGVRCEIRCRIEEAHRRPAPAIAEI